MASSKARRWAPWRCPNRTRRRLHRHGRDGTARQHHAGRRRLQVHRRRQNLEAHGPRRTRRRSRASASIPRIPTSSTSRRWATLTDRTTSAACSAPRTAARPGRRCCSGATTPARWILPWIRTIPNVLFAAIWDVYRTPWSLSSGGPQSGLFKIHRRRRPLDRDHAQSRPAHGHHRQDRRQRFRRAIRNRVYAIVEAEDGGVFASDDAGATLDEGQRRSQGAAARVLLLAHLCRSRKRRTPSTC